MDRIPFKCVPVALGTVLSLSVPTQVAAEDALRKAWLARSEAASSYLERPGLDACDQAIGRAFQKPREIKRGPFRSFELDVELSGQSLRAAYSYRDGELASFELRSLPRGWIARQRSNTKTLSILVGPATCAMDFCTADPFKQGPCAGDVPE